MGDNFSYSIKTLPLNIIFYGPPGTGKTYLLQTKLFPMFLAANEEESRNEFIINSIKKLSWWQVIALAMLNLKETKVPALTKHEFIQIKANLSSRINLESIIWTNLQAHAKSDCAFIKYSDRIEPLLFIKNWASIWSIDIKAAYNDIPDLINLNNKLKNYQPIKKIKKQYEFITFHQSYAYEDFVEGMKPVIGDEYDEENIKYKIEDGVFKRGKECYAKSRERVCFIY